MTNEELIERFRQRMANQGKEGVVTLGDNVCYQTPTDPCIKKGTVELIATIGAWYWFVGMRSHG